MLYDEPAEKTRRAEVLDGFKRDLNATKARISRSRDTCAAPAAAISTSDADVPRSLPVETAFRPLGTAEPAEDQTARGRNDSNLLYSVERSYKTDECHRNQTTALKNGTVREECYRHVEGKIRSGMSSQESRLRWLQIQVAARLQAKQRAIDAGEKMPVFMVVQGPGAEKCDKEPGTNLSSRETSGVRVPPPAWMPGQTAEARGRREILVAEDFIAGKYDTPTEKEKTNEERRRVRAKRRVRQRLGEQLRRDMLDIDWNIVTKRIDAKNLGFPSEMIKEPPTTTAVFAAQSLAEGRAKEVYGYPGKYLPYVRSVLHIIYNPEPKDSSTTIRNRTKVAYLESLGAKITEDAEWARSRHEGDEVCRAEEETRWKLQMLQERANPMARAVWDAALQSNLTRRGRDKLVYVDGLPVDLRPVMPRIAPGRWETRRDAVYRWSPCLQCKVARVGECSAARALAKKPEHRPCRRCRREGLTCIRGDDELEHRSDRSLAEMGMARWETYESADHTSLTKAEAQAVAREMLEPRGKKLLNVCGVMVDAEDARGFAPLPKTGPSTASWLQWMDDGEVEGKPPRKRQDAEEPNGSSKKAALSQGDIFAKRMAVLHCDEYWQEKAEAVGSWRRQRKDAKPRTRQGAGKPISSYI